MVRTRDIFLVALATLVIFGAGVMTGGLLVRSRAEPWSKNAAASPTSPPPLAAAPLFPARFNALSQSAEQLGDLTPAQRTRIRHILRDGRERMADFFLIFEPDIQQVFRKMREDVRAELTPDQQRRLEDLLKQRPRRAQNWTGAGTEGPPPE